VLSDQTQQEEVVVNQCSALTRPRVEPTQVVVEQAECHTGEQIAHYRLGFSLTLDELQR
jgi:hypothetical protein